MNSNTMVSDVLAETFIGTIPMPDVYECLLVQKRTHAETNTSGLMITFGFLSDCCRRRWGSGYEEG
jgi:hypothetical protein